MFSSLVAHNNKLKVEASADPIDAWWTGKSGRRWFALLGSSSMDERRPTREEERMRPVSAEKQVYRTYFGTGHFTTSAKTISWHLFGLGKGWTGVTFPYNDNEGVCTATVLSLVLKHLCHLDSARSSPTRSP